MKALSSQTNIAKFLKTSGFDQVVKRYKKVGFVGVFPAVGQVLGDELGLDFLSPYDDLHPGL